MSNKYKHGDVVPTEVLANRLNELSNDITKGNLNQFVMRIPAELDFCPDLVMSAAAERLLSREKLIDRLMNSESCPCGNVGYFVGQDFNSGDPVQEQCEFCYTNKNSRFLVMEEIKNERNN